MIRLAEPADVPAINHLRLQVLENQLSNPDLVTEAMTTEAITNRGRGWVFEKDDEISGFSIALKGSQNPADTDYAEPCIWALFVHPQHEAQGVGHALYRQAEQWLWSLGVRKIWLSTEAGTRADRFYRDRGWSVAGELKNGDLKLELERP